MLEGLGRGTESDWCFSGELVGHCCKEEEEAGATVHVHQVWHG